MGEGRIFGPRDKEMQGQEQRKTARDRIILGTALKKGGNTKSEFVDWWPKENRGDRQTLKHKILGGTAKKGQRKNMSWWTDDRGSSEEKDRLSSAGSKGFSNLDSKPAEEKK
jgi:hypothetical protein